jgi:hypothetical protein
MNRGRRPTRNLVLDGGLTAELIKAGDRSVEFCVEIDSEGIDKFT